SVAEREALLKAIKLELKQQLWKDSRARLTHDRYWSLFTMNPEPMWVYDTRTLQILDLNEAAIQRYGYTREEFLGLTSKDLRPAEDVPKFLELTHELPNSDRTGPWRHRLAREHMTLRLPPAIKHALRRQAGKLPGKA
ncbi:MAG: PAS domain S-box protein, partial [Candidatus Dormibacteraceae bacterium]